MCRQWGGEKKVGINTDSWLKTPNLFWIVCKTNLLVISRGKQTRQPIYPAKLAVSQRFRINLNKRLIKDYSSFKTHGMFVTNRFFINFHESFNFFQKKGNVFRCLKAKDLANLVDVIDNNLLENWTKINNELIIFFECKWQWVLLFWKIAFGLWRSDLLIILKRLINQKQKNKNQKVRGNAPAWVSRSLASNPRGSRPEFLFFIFFYFIFLLIWK